MSKKLKKILITSPLKNELEEFSDCDIYYLGEWCIDYEANNNEQKYKFATECHLKNRSKFEKDYKYLEELNERFLSSVAKLLNEKHSLKKSDEYWRVIVGPWLLTYICLIWDHWESLRLAFEKNSFDEAIIFEKNPFESFAPLNHSNAVELMTKDHLWNHAIFSKILKFKYADSLSFKYEDVSICVDSEKVVQNRNYSYTNKFKSFIDSLSRGLRDREDIVFHNSYFSFGSYLRLCLKLRVLPRFYFELDQYIEMPNSKNRKNHALSFFSMNDFEEFVVNNILDDIPISYMEGYNIICRKVQDIAQNCKSIFTANAYWSNDTFKIFCANKKDDGVKIILSSHGGSLGFKYTNFSHEEKIADIYAVWHKENKNNHFQVQPNILGAKRKYKKNGKNLLILGIDLPTYVRTYQSGVRGSLMLEDYNQKVEFICSLNTKITQSVKIRSFNDEGWKTKQRFEKILSSNKILKPMKLKHAFDSSKIIVCTYPETSFLEAMYSNIPTILLHKKEYYEFNPAFDYAVQVLEKAKIIFSDPLKASSHVNEIWDNPESWWNKDEVHSARKIFFEYCGNADENWLDSWANFINDYALITQ